MAESKVKSIKKNGLTAETSLLCDAPAGSPSCPEGIVNISEIPIRKL
jgi:hypothetical protein